MGNKTRKQRVNPSQSKLYATRAPIKHTTQSQTNKLPKPANIHSSTQKLRQSGSKSSLTDVQIRNLIGFIRQVKNHLTGF